MDLKKENLEKIKYKYLVKFLCIEDLSKLTVEDLKDICRFFRYHVVSKLKKQDIINFINNNEINNDKNKVLAFEFLLSIFSRNDLIYAFNSVTFNEKTFGDDLYEKYFKLYNDNIDEQELLKKKKNEEKEKEKEEEQKEKEKKLSLILNEENYNDVLVEEETECYNSYKLAKKQFKIYQQEKVKILNYLREKYIYYTEKIKNYEENSDEYRKCKNRITICENKLLEINIQNKDNIKECRKFNENFKIEIDEIENNINKNINNSISRNNLYNQGLNYESIHYLFKYDEKEKLDNFDLYKDDEKEKLDNL